MMARGRDERGTLTRWSLWRGALLKERKKVLLGTKMAVLSFEIAAHCEAKRTLFIVENPETSMLWKMNGCMKLISDNKAGFVEFDMCAYGSLSKKPAKLFTNWGDAGALRWQCPGKSCFHQHVALENEVWHPRKKRRVFRTSLAQEYPTYLVHAWSKLAATKVWSRHPEEACHLLCR